MDGIIYGIVLYSVFRWYPEEITKNVPYTKVMFNKSILLSDLYRTIAFTVICFIVNYSFLRNGQTIGKRLLHIQVADVQGKVASIWRMFFLREIIFVQIIHFMQLLIVYFFHSYYVLDDNTISLLWRWLGLIFLINVLFIYRRDRRCIHDFFARTIVIQLPSR